MKEAQKRMITILLELSCASLSCNEFGKRCCKFLKACYKFNTFNHYECLLFDIILEPHLDGLDNEIARCQKCLLSELEPLD